MKTLERQNVERATRSVRFARRAQRRWAELPFWHNDDPKSSAYPKFTPCENLRCKRPECIEHRAGIAAQLRSRAHKVNGTL